MHDFKMLLAINEAHGNIEMEVHSVHLFICLFSVNILRLVAKFKYYVNMPNQMQLERDFFFLYHIVINRIKIRIFH